MSSLRQTANLSRLALVLTCLIGLASTLAACSSDEVLRSVYEGGRSACKHADNCDVKND